MIFFLIYFFCCTFRDFQCLRIKIVFVSIFILSLTTARLQSVNDCIDQVSSFVVVRLFWDQTSLIFFMIFAVGVREEDLQSGIELREGAEDSDESD